MNAFELSQNVIKTIIDELSDAEEYIKIAIFQLHNQKIFDLLNKKIREGVQIELFTLPYDSINENVRNRVENQFKTLLSNGAILHFCRWNVGDPERTSTAVGRWYSFHGKFIVTDKSAIALSANFIDQDEIDAVLIYRNEPNIIAKYNEIFEGLISLFIKPHNGREGKIASLILSSSHPDPASLLRQPKTMQTDRHENYWIKEYPSELSPEEIDLSGGLYICPFNIRGRNIVYKIIDNAQDFLYIVTESFTDPEIINELIKASLMGLKIKILTGSQSMDFSDRIQNNFRYLLSQDIELKTTQEALHAKLLITDKLLAVGSINLNKMNLGFKKSNNTWRENTETITISTDEALVADAKHQFLEIFTNGIDIELVLMKKLKSDITSFFTSNFGLHSEQDVKTMFSKFILNEEVNVKRKMIKVGKICKKLMDYFDKTRISRNDFLMALIVYYLSDNKLSYNQIEEKLLIFDVAIKLDIVLAHMIVNKFIEKDEDYYKINIMSLFDRGLHGL